jgi:hypothetical protein
MKRRIFAVAAFAMLAVAPSAFALGKGNSLLSLGLGQSTAPVADVFYTGSGRVFPSSQPAINYGAQYWYMASDDYAFTVTGKMAYGNQKWEPADKTDAEAKRKLSGYSIRVGGDRVGKIGERFTMYFGPGLEYASHKDKVEVSGQPDVETGNSTFIGINGRIGGIMMLSPTIGISGEIANSFGQTSSEDDTDPVGTAKTTWTSSDFSAFWGLTFAFGGTK